jgi:cytochrome c
MTTLPRQGSLYLYLTGSAFLLAAAVAGGCGPSASTGSKPDTAKPAAPRASSPSSPAAGTSSAAPTGTAVAGSPPPVLSPTKKPFDPCDESGPVPREFAGILRVARCEQDMYLTMASVATQLGVECQHCHVVPDPTQPKKFDFPVMTPKKEIANWMNMHLMQAVKPVDGSPLKCKSCHTDAAGKPVAKILGNPRDVIKAQEWMSMVMVNKFVSKSGEKLKCKSCHVGNFTTPQFQAKVLLRSEQIPPH